MACAMSCGRIRADFSRVKAGTKAPTAPAGIGGEERPSTAGIGGQDGTSTMHGGKDTVNQSEAWPGRGVDKTLRENGFGVAAGYRRNASATKGSLLRLQAFSF